MAVNIFEWYDCSIYGFFAYAIGENFFPSARHRRELIEAFGIVSPLASWMRPIGALLFAPPSVRVGGATRLHCQWWRWRCQPFSSGLLPTFKQIGVTASILMVVLRLVQGLSVGGEYTPQLFSWSKDARTRAVG